MKKPKLFELDLVRAIAILAVLIIHATANATVELQWGTSHTAPFYLALNAFSVFAVPVFVFLSGLVLFYQYADSWNGKQILGFYGKRIQFILVPYLVWSFAYYVVYQWMNNKTITIDWADFASKLVWAEIGYHLYFMIIIMQFYLLFPILMTLVQRFSWLKRNIALVGVVIHLGFYSYHVWVQPFLHNATLLTTYLALFTIGGAIGMNYERFVAAAHRLWWVFGLAVAFGFMYLLLIILSYDEVGYGPIPYEILYNGYAILVSISLLWISRMVVRSESLIVRWLKNIGIMSFGIYLIHPLLLGWYQQLYVDLTPKPNYHLFNLVGYLFILIVSWLIVLMVRRVKGSWILFGR